MYPVPYWLSAEVVGEWNVMLYPYLQTQLIRFLSLILILSFSPPGVTPVNPTL